MSDALLALTNAHVVPVTGDPFDGTVLVEGSRIRELGPDVRVPESAQVLDAGGQWLLPGLVDAHTHLGVHEEGEGWAGNDSNEMTDPVMAGVRALDAVNPFDTGFDDALAGGVTTANINPGSGNPIGGQAVALHTHGRYLEEMVLRAPSGLKSALGENPKRIYSEKKQTPSTRLGTAMVIRQAFMDAQNYMGKADPDARDPHMEALAMVLRREIPWRQHAHRADDIGTALRLADEFGYDLVLDHGTEAHLLADVLAERGVPVLIGPLFTTRSKVELRGRSMANPGKLAAAGVEISIITDHPVVPVNFLIYQAALAVKEGLERKEALRSVTINPARVLGLADRLGSLEPGKDADLVLWSGDPLDVMQRAMRVWIGGREVYRYDAATREQIVAPR
ncbi:amidohydrolase [Arthrobacter sp. zg-Y40]|uniref:amidohydrolase n=1 Tax=unclassified Arthrobacter TaxID=235627 RepID=UPI001D13FBF6|nr:MULTISPECIES: amidohydrolase [unclassified Arthrobacter]MCC3276023.1 amidohydrolase [Arthrobacter sp. zg-Y20]MCC3277994.1 amidohydrolase [Arthrobacter sp. zg-Y40]MDK1316180.1 amidohydrolase [Arthrobacter sp. zg.Y20]WIB05538.1 amidohydrolase [Arthrobacter sp. zg-Y20]